ncbi:DNA-directed RNA polymerase specialized sigma subunit [Paenibacillus algorifonticola]|uniref:DNA-directed RNA polymerase specialized sigma subunit n=1 Tax=Paenibacillus algorifonticola TaxID=684063 RepID=A0A1I1XUA6_9BACL|nr:hypothetical protein [Paenibacillus algorifonticola]SFE10937.1 DNA-directed RNA polymerase specialized sigma subunit [Paenibacillus algorifonticola]
MNAEPAHLENVIDQHLYLVRYAIGRYRWAIGQHGIAKEDLESEATIGLIKAHKRFDPSRLNSRGQSVKFSSFALPYILGEIGKYLWKYQPIKVSQAVYNLAGKILKQGLTEQPAAEIAQQLQANELAAQRALNYLRESKPSSLDAPLGEDCGTLCDVLPEEIDDTEANVSLFVNELSQVERKILQLLNKGMDPTAAAPKLGLSTTRMKIAVAELRRKASSHFDYKGDAAVKKLTKDAYAACKARGVADTEIAKEFKVSKTFIYESKKSWGLVGMSNKSTKGGQGSDDPSVQDPPIVSHQPEKTAEFWMGRFEASQMEFEKAANRVSDLERENGLLKSLLKNYL